MVPRAGQCAESLSSTARAILIRGTSAACHSTRSTLPEQPSDDGAEELRLVLATCYELDRLDVEDLSPARFILEHGLEHRLGLGGRSEELDDLLDLV
jgi:hypothetical protein